jgi:VWFA-related protein
MKACLVLNGATALLAGEADQPLPASGSLQPSVSITPWVRPVKVIMPQTAADRGAVIRVDTTVVLIPVSVTDQMGRFVTGLEKEHFTLTEDKIAQRIASVSGEDVPLSIGIVLDTSGSMGAKLRQAGQAVANFLRLATPEDEFFLVQFNDRSELTVPFTSNTGDIQNRLSFVRSKGRTALLDGVYLAIHEMKKARNARKAIVIISDGGDNSSRYTDREVRRSVQEADVQIYAIGIFEPIGGRGTSSEELNGPALLGEITAQTGGRHFHVTDLAVLPDIAAKIGLELRNQYLLAYAPKGAVRDGKYRRVQVGLVKLLGLPSLNIAFRRGYYSPAW